MLAHAVLHDLRAVPHLPQGTVHAPHHRSATVAQLARHCELAHGRPLVERLQPRGRVRVPERLRPNLTRFPTSPHRHRVEQLAEVDQHRFLARLEHGNSKRLGGRSPNT